MAEIDRRSDIDREQDEERKRQAPTGYRPSGYSHGMDPSYEDWQGPASGTSTPGGWEPRLETLHRDDTMFVRVELPGWDKDEVSVCLEDEDLVVEGMRQEEGEEDDRHRPERFTTRVALPGKVEPSDIKAKFKNGVLEVRVPMPERRAERRIVKIDS